MNIRRHVQTFVSGSWLRSSLRRPLAALPDRVGWGEFVTLAALLVCAGGLYTFVEIVDDALEGETHRFDRTVLMALRTTADPADPVGPPWLEITLRDLTALGGYPVIATVGLLAIGYLAMLRRWGAILLVVASLLGGTLLNHVLKNTLDRPRPELVAHLIEVETSSLPSGHAMLSAVAYLTLGALLAQVQTWRPLKLYIVAAAVALTILIGFSRVYLGVHWPTDVLAGWGIGAAWAMACWLIARFAIRKR